MLLTRTGGAVMAGLFAFASTGCAPGPTVSVSAKFGSVDATKDRRMSKRVGLAEFMRDLRSPRSGQQYFSVAVEGSKVGTRQGAVWVDGLKVVDGAIEGRVVPGSGRDCKIVTVDESEVCDWMIVEGGRVKGGFTLRE